MHSHPVSLLCIVVLRRVSEQQPGPEDEVKQEASRVSPSSAKGPAVLTALKPEPSETKHEQMGSSRDGRSVSPDVKRVTDTVTDKKSSKRHKRHKEGREHKSKHRSKRHDSPSRLASQSPPPVVRDPTPEVKAPTPEPEVLPQPLPQTIQTDRWDAVSIEALRKHLFGTLSVLDTEALENFVLLFFPTCPWVTNVTESHAMAHGSDHPCLFSGTLFSGLPRNKMMFATSMLRNQICTCLVCLLCCRC